jgi:hypothetical protein
MMNGAVVHNKDTACGRVWIHLLNKARYEFEECVAIEGTKLNAAVNDAVKRESGQYWKPVPNNSENRSMKWYNKPDSADETRPLAGPLTLDCPAIFTVCIQLVDGTLINEDKIFGRLVSNAENIFGPLDCTTLNCNLWKLWGGWVVSKVKTLQKMGLTFLWVKPSSFNVR